MKIFSNLLFKFKKSIFERQKKILSSILIGKNQLFQNDFNF